MKFSHSRFIKREKQGFGDAGEMSIFETLLKTNHTVQQEARPQNSFLAPPLKEARPYIHYVEKNRFITRCTLWCLNTSYNLFTDQSLTGDCLLYPNSELTSHPPLTMALSVPLRSQSSLDLTACRPIAAFPLLLHCVSIKTDSLSDCLALESLPKQRQQLVHQPHRIRLSWISYFGHIWDLKCPFTVQQRK